MRKLTLAPLLTNRRGRATPLTTGRHWSVGVRSMISTLPCDTRPSRPPLPRTTITPRPPSIDSAPAGGLAAASTPTGTASASTMSPRARRLTLRVWGAMVCPRSGDRKETVSPLSEVVVVEPPAALAAQQTGVQHRHEPGRRRHPRLAQLCVESLRGVHVHVDADEIGELTGPHRPAGAVLHRRVEVLGGHARLVED